MRSKPIVLLTVLSLWGLWDVSAHADVYTFQNIVDDSSQFITGGSLTAEFRGAVINNNRQIAFDATLTTGESGFFRHNSDGSITTIVTDSILPGNYVGGTTASINDSGEVAFRVDLPNGQDGVYKGSGGALTTIASTPSTARFIGNTVNITNAGNVVFNGTPLVGGLSILSGNGGPLVNSIPGVTDVFGRARTSGNGLVGYLSRTANNDTAMMIHDGTNQTVIEDATGVVEGFFFVGGINDNAVAAFTGRPAGTADQYAVHYGDGNTVTEVANTFGDFERLGFADINNSNLVVFQGLTASGFGIYTGPNINADKVIAPGDALFGNTVANTDFEIGGLNDNGDIVFTYQLNNGTKGVALASLTTVPEPSAFILAFLGFSFVVMLRRGHRTAKAS